MATGISGNPRRRPPPTARATPTGPAARASFATVAMAVATCSGRHAGRATRRWPRCRSGRIRRRRTRIRRPSARPSRRAASVSSCWTGRGGARSRDLALPANLVLLELPPYSPAINPMETVFQYPRGNRLANRVFADAVAVAEACCKAWDWFAAAPGRIASIMRRERATVPAPVQTNHNG